MQTILSYLRDYYKSIDPRLLLFCCVYAAILIFLNYRFSIEPKIIGSLPHKYQRFAAFYLVYAAAFCIPYVVVVLLKGNQDSVEWPLLVLVLTAPAIFALKVTMSGVREFVELSVGGSTGRFYAILVNLPSRLVIVLIPLAMIWWLGRYEAPFFGATIRNVNWKPYLLMLVIMIPLISWASLQDDFLRTYPKMRQIDFITAGASRSWPQRLLFEIAYGLDFVTIELFFRGFLVLAFVRYAGQEAILPMAVFYCSIHFGKPLAECISSFFGGMLLGILVYRTGSIAGGLAVHLGIAWMMEAGGYIGSIIRHKT